MFDFPTTPAVGTIVQVPDGSWRRWDGVKWGPTPGPGPQALQVFIGDAPPGPPGGPLHGELWFNSYEQQMYIWYDDPNSSQWVIVTANVGGISADAPVDNNLYGRFNGSWELVNSPASGGPFLPVSGGSLNGALGLFGTSNTISNFDAKVWATGGATVPGNDGQGELNYMAGRHVFQGYDGTTQFRIANIPWSWQWWEASGGSSGGITTLRTGSDLNPDCSGAIAMQGHGNLTLGNGEGTIAQFMNINAPIINYIQFQPGGYNQGVSIRAAGGDGLPTPFAIAANYNGSVNLSNSNGPLLVASDGQASGLPVASYFHFTTPNAGGGAVIGLTAGSQSNENISLCSLGTGAVVFCTSGSTAQVRVLNTASAVATVDILGAVSGGSPAIRASTGNLSLGNGGGIGTNATSGMIQIPYCAGTPTGVPTNASSYATMLYDATANKLWIYSGSAWRGTAFT